MERVLITGSAGFIGSFLTERFLAKGITVIGIDNLSNGSLQNLANCTQNPNHKFFLHDICDTRFVKELLIEYEISEVWHLAANTDIISSHKSPLRDFRDGVEATISVLESMRESNARKIIFASSGSVYGDLGKKLAVAETDGPLKPLSTYGAGKLASEAFIAAYANLYGIEGHIFRFGNVLGSRINHGVIFDFISRLCVDNSKLRILGNGKQEKNYFRISDCINGMLEISSLPLVDEYCRIINLGNSSLTNVLDIAKICMEVVDCRELNIEIDGGELAWPGDQPIIRLDCSLSKSLGWECEFDSSEAVRMTARELYESQKTL